MTRVSHAQQSFAAGEFSPLLFARSDTESYVSGLGLCRNSFPLSQGAWTRRSGTLFLTRTKFFHRQARLIPFVLSASVSYIVEVGHQYMRFFASGGIVASDSRSITGITKANPAVLSYSGSTGFANGDRVLVTGVGGMGQVNGREFVVASAGANSFSLQEDLTGTPVNVDSTGYDAYTSGGTVFKILEIASPYQESDLPLLRWVQSIDTLYLLHPNYAPRKLTRVSPTSFLLTTASFNDGPYFPTNATPTTLTPSGTSGSVTVMASSTTGINNGQGFLSSDVGRSIRLLHGSTWGWGEITAVGSSTSVTVSVKSAFGGTTATTSWRLGLWSGTTGFPTVGAFFEGRLFLGGATASPQRVDGSKTFFPEDFAPSSTSGVVADDNAVSIVLESNDANVIRWLVADEKGLLCGTSGSEWIIRAASLNEALAPRNVSAKPTTRYGSFPVAPVSPGKAVLFIQRSGQRVREFAYVFESDGFRAPDISLLAEHLFSTSVVEAVFQPQPQPMVWFRRADGLLLGLTYERERGALAWHQHEFGGASDEEGTRIPVVESMAVAPAVTSGEDVLYLIVQRHINGVTRRYVELLTPTWRVDQASYSAFFVDAGVTRLLSPAGTSVGGLWHLEGQTVAVLADGATVTPAIVTNGKITLPVAASVVQVGLSYVSEADTLPVPAATVDGSPQLKIRRIHRIGFFLLDTLGLRYGPVGGSLTQVLTRVFGELYGDPPGLFSGVYRERLEADYDRLGRVHWEISDPTPAVVLAVAQQLEVADAS